MWFIDLLLPVRVLGQVSELLLPNTQKLYRFCLDYIARHFDVVAASYQHHLDSLSSAAMVDLVSQNTFSIDEPEIYAAVRAWAHAAASGAGAAAAASELASLCSSPTAATAAIGLHALSTAGASMFTATDAADCPAAAHMAVGAHAPMEPAATALQSACSAPPGGISGDCLRGTLADAGDGAACTPKPTARAVVALSAETFDRAMSAPTSHGGEQTAATAATAEKAAYPLLQEDPVLAADISRVLGLIRFPLLPISDLLACLTDPLLRHLPPVLGVLHEVLEVHQRETAGPLLSSPGPSPCGRTSVRWRELFLATCVPMRACMHARCGYMRACSYKHYALIVGISTTATQALCAGDCSVCST